MSVMEAEVFEAFRSIGIGDDKASAAAQALSKRDPDIAILKSDVGNLKTDTALLKWMTGFGLALNVAILLKLFMK